MPDSLTYKNLHNNLSLCDRRKKNSLRIHKLNKILSKAIITKYFNFKLKQNDKL